MKGIVTHILILLIASVNADTSYCNCLKSDYGDCCTDFKGDCGTKRASYQVAGCCTNPEATAPPTTPCAAGTFEKNDTCGGGGVCLDCEAGKYQPQPGQTSCLSCEAGKYQDQSRQTSCKVPEECPIDDEEAVLEYSNHACCAQDQCQRPVWIYGPTCSSVSCCRTKCQEKSECDTFEFGNNYCGLYDFSQATTPWANVYAINGISCYSYRTKSGGPKRTRPKLNVAADYGGDDCT